jgi:hypothetical protein
MEGIYGKDGGEVIQQKFGVKITWGTSVLKT